MKSINVLYSSQKNRKYWLSLPFSDISDSSSGSKKSQQIKIDKGTESHPILGMGYSFEHSSCSNLLKLPEAQRKDLLLKLISPTGDLQFNLWRVCIGTSDFTGTPWYSYCDTPPGPGIDAYGHLQANFSIDRDRNLIIPILKEALSINSDIKFFGSPWSPPGWMKDSGSMLGGRLLPEFYGVYAEYLINFIEAYAEEGIPIFALTVQNEPLHNTKSMPSCRWKAQEENNFIQNYLGPRIAAMTSKSKPKIWCYDHNFEDYIPNSPAGYPQIILDDPKTKPYVDGIGFHHYSNFPGKIRGNPRIMESLRKKYPDVPLYFTEGSLFGMRGASRLCKYFRYGSSSYNGWVMFLDKNGKPNNGPFHASKTFVQLNQETREICYNFDYYMYGHFSKYLSSDTYVLNTSDKVKRGLEFLVLKDSIKNQIAVICVNNRVRRKRFAIHCEGKIARFKLPPRSIITLSWAISP